MLRKEKVFREGISDAGKAARKKYRNKPETKLMEKEYYAKWSKKPESKLKMRQKNARRYERHPEQLQAFLQKCRLLGRKLHIVTAPKRSNLDFIKVSKLDHSLLRESLLTDFNDLNKNAQQSLFALIDLTYNTEDSTANNYAYVYCDSRFWDDEMTFEEFLESIFYIGRGIGCRFVDHARDTQILLNNETPIDPEKVSLFESFSFNFQLFSLQKKAQLQKFGLIKLQSKRFFLILKSLLRKSISLNLQ